MKAAADQLLGLVTDPALGTAVLCSHGEVIGQVLQQLVAGGLVLADPLRWEKGSTWVLDSRGGVVVGARYLAPLRPPGLAAFSEEAVSGGPSSP